MKLLDLFCGAGGCSVGYTRAGFDVTGIDHAPMPFNPYWDVLQGDALLYLADKEYLDQFDVVHASPPCQAHSILKNRTGVTYVDLVPPVRALLQLWGGPYVIENVAGAPLVDPLLLCGSMFGLGVNGAVLRRHRLFESNMKLSAPSSDACQGVPTIGVYGNGGSWTPQPGVAGSKVAGPEAATALGVDWTDYQPVLAQMIPPAYTEYIGRQIINQLDKDHQK